jgi:hypothetical protein
MRQAGFCTGQQQQQRRSKQQQIGHCGSRQ